MLYCTFSLFSFLYLVFAAYFSDWRSFRARAVGINNGWTILLDLAERLLRYLGKVVAWLNAGIIILGCLFQFTAVYNSCYCDSNKISCSSDAFLIYLNSSEKAELASVSWAIGFAMGLAPCLGAILYIEILKCIIRQISRR